MHINMTRTTMGINAGACIKRRRLFVFVNITTKHHITTLLTATPGPKKIKGKSSSDMVSSQKHSIPPEVVPAPDTGPSSHILSQVGSTVLCRQVTSQDFVHETGMNETGELTDWTFQRRSETPSRKQNWFLTVAIKHTVLQTYCAC